jgi:hypothetical protein
MSSMRWKYTTVGLSWTWRQGGLEAKVQAELERYAAQGWELSHLTQTPHSGLLLIFRRPA